MRKAGIFLQILVLIGALLLSWSSAIAATDGFYQLSPVKALWDGTDANRTKAPSVDYDYTYGDESAVTYTLPWPVKLYGQSYSAITADTNGNIWFSSTKSAHSFSLANTGHGPVIAVMNNDLSSYYYGGVFIQHKTNPERIVIEWQTETYFNEGSESKSDFEAVLFSNGTIRIDYKYLDPTFTQDFGSGISRDNGVNYLTVATAVGKAEAQYARSFNFSPPTTPEVVFDQTSNQSNQTITGTYTGSNVTVAVDSTAKVGPITYLPDGTWTTTLSDLPNGLTVVYVTTTDENGNSTTKTKEITVDAIPPTVHINAPKGSVNSTTPRLDFTVSDGTVRVLVDGNAVIKVSGDNLDSLSEGNHILSVEATDTAGNITTGQTYFFVDTKPPRLPVAIPQISATDHTLYLQADGTLLGWGDNGLGQLGLGNEISSVTSPQSVLADTQWSRIAAGGGHSLGLQPDGTLWSWGDDSYGQLGYEVSSTSYLGPIQYIPAKVGGDNDHWQALAAGVYFSSAIKSDGTLWMWGDNFYGQLGDPSVPNLQDINNVPSSTIPVRVGSVDDRWTAVATGYSHTLAIRADGTLWGWGSNNYGQVGSLDTTFVSTYGGDIYNHPVMIGSVNDRWIAVAAGDYHSIAIKSDGTLWAWGRNDVGQVGNVTVTPHSDSDTPYFNQPVLVGQPTDVWYAISAGQRHTLAIKSDKTLWAWGYNSSGQLGIGSRDNKNEPTLVGTTSDRWLTVAAGSRNSYGIMNDGTVWSWGKNSSGMMDDGNNNAQYAPSPVKILGNDYIINNKIQINEDAGVTGSNTVKLTLAMSDASGIAEMQFSNDGINWSTPETYATIKSWQLSDGYGTKTVYFRFMDNAGNWSESFSRSIVYGDFPVVSLTSPANGIFQNSNTTVLEFSVSRGVPVVKVDGVVIAKQSGDVLGPLADGAHTVTIHVVEGQYTISDSATFTIDTMSPVFNFPGFLSINDGALVTSAQSVMLRLSPVDQTAIDKMQFSNDGIIWSSPESYTQTKTWDLSSGNGEKTVSARVKDSAGNWSDVVTATITLNLPPDLSITSPAHGSIINTATPTLLYTVSRGTAVIKVDGVVVSKQSGNNLAPLTEGRHTVIVVVTEGQSTYSAWSAFVIDTKMPSSSASPAAGFYNTPQNITLSCNDGVDGSGCAATYYCFGEGCAPTTRYSGPLPLTAPQVVRYFSQDIAGNAETIKQDEYWGSTVTGATPPLIINTVAGGGVGDGGPATAAILSSPNGLAMDTSGNIYISDIDLNTVRKVNTVTGVITTVAGNGFYGYSGDNGLATSASLGYPESVAVDGKGNLYIADSDNNVIRKVDAATGLIATIAGNGDWDYSGDGGPAINASFYYPSGVALDSADNLYIADMGNSVIRKIDALTGQISTVVGNGTVGYAGDGGVATLASLQYPSAVVVDGIGNLFIADRYNLVIRKVDAGTSFITTVAGNGDRGYSGDGYAAISASFSSPNGVAVDNVGNLYIADMSNCVIRKVDAGTGNISTIAGNGDEAYTGDGGAAIAASLNYPSSVIIAQNGDIIIADTDNSVVRKVLSSSGAISTIAGKGSNAYAGDGGPAINASLQYPSGIAVDRNGNYYIADTWDSVIRKVDRAGIITTLAGNGVDGYSGDRGTALQASLKFPEGIALDAAGNVYVADTGNSVIRKVDVGTGVITTVAGNGTLGYSGDGGDATSATLRNPLGIAIYDDALYIADTRNYVVRKVNLATGLITTIAGNGYWGYYGDGMSASYAAFKEPSSVTVDSANHLFVADSGSCVVRKVDTDTGAITTVAGNGTCGYAGDGGAATVANLSYPRSVMLDNVGNIYIADTGNAVIREVYAGSGEISTVVGNQNWGFSGDGGPAVAASLACPQGLALDGTGSILIADKCNDRIRMVSPSPLPVTAVTPPGGTYNSPQRVTLSTNTSATIYYTTDGTIPTFSSPIYSGPIEISASTTLEYFAKDANGIIEAVNISVYTFATAPGAPTAVTAVAGNGQASVSFTAPATNGGSPITFYTVTATPDNIATIGTSSPITVTGLTNGVAYTFTVTATNAAGTGPASAPSNTVTPTIPDTVPPVTAAFPLGGVYYAAQTVTLSCNDGIGSGCAATYYCFGDNCTPTSLYGGDVSIASSSKFSFYSKDNAGNPEAVQTLSFIIDTVPPTVTIDPVTTPTRISNQTMTGSVTAGALITITANTTVTIGSVTYPTATTWACEVSNFVPDDNTFTVTATNAAKKSASANATIRFTPPLTMSISPPTIAANQRQQLTLIITNLITSGGSVTIEQYIDTNGNKILDPADYPIRTFTVTDGFTSTNPNILGDNDAVVSGRITTVLADDLLNNLYHAPGNYILKATSGGEAATAVFTVTAVTQSQSISGDVSDGTSPIPGAIIKVTDKAQQIIGYAITDTAGHYTIYLKDAGDYLLSPTAPGYAASASGIPVNVTTGPATQNLTLARGTYHLTGRVKDETNSAPVSGVWVEAVSDTYRAQGLTGTDGSYDLLLLSGTYKVSVSCDQSVATPAQQGYLCFSNAVRVSELNADSTGNDILLPKATVPARGTIITDQTSTPITGLPIIASLPTATDSRGFLATAVTDSQGNFTTVITNGRWELSLDDRIAQIIGYIGSRTTCYSTTTDPITDNNLTAYPITGWISGSVKDTSNTPVPDVAIILRNSDTSIGARTVTALDGTYRIGAFAGDWYLNALTGERGLHDVAEQVVILADSGTATADFVAERKDPGLALIPVTILTTSGTETITGTAATGATVTITADTQITVGTVSVDGTIWRCPLTSLSAGDNVVTITAALAGQQQTTTMHIYYSTAGTSELPLVISTASLSNGNVNLFYQQPVNALDGRAPYLWSISSGTLPNGLAINPVSGEIFGKPTQSGSFDVTVQVRDAEGALATRPFTIVIGSEIFKAYFTATPLSGQTPLVVYFNDLSSGTPATWEWDFGDGGTSCERNPQHIYTSPGMYTVSLTTGKDTLNDTATRTGYIVIGACVNQPVRLLNNLAMLLFNDLQSAYTNAGNGDTLQLQAFPLNTDLIFARDVQIFLRGGFDCSYQVNDAAVINNGALRVQNGTVKIDKLRLFNR